MIGILRGCPLTAAFGFAAFPAFSQEAAKPVADAKPEVKFPAGAVKPGLPEDFQPYVETLPGTKLSFMMVPIPGGEFTMGSAPGEEGREENEGPPIKVKVSPFWMAAYEVTWDEYDAFYQSTDLKAAKAAGAPRSPTDKAADAVTRPTPPYVDMTFGRGHDRIPASCMTSHAAIHYSKWVASKTAKDYRLPTEAEWEYAARAGTTTKFFFGDDIAKLDDYAWHSGNSDEKPHPIGLKKPNPWGLHDILGNVREWTLDEYKADYHKKLGAGPVHENPLMPAATTTKQKHIWHAVRGGSWLDDKTWCRPAWRIGAEEDWSVQDPQLPKSIWWHTDASFVGMRLVRPYKPAGVAPTATPTVSPAAPK